MLKPFYTKRFKKDLKKIDRSGQKDMAKFKEVAVKLINQEMLDEKYKDHALSGNYQGRRDCHIEPDWILIYKVSDDTVTFERTGSHSELFK